MKMVFAADAPSQSERSEINFDERLKKPKIIDELKDKGNSHYDCIIPVKGVKTVFFKHTS